jgi:hypothetical protein
MDWIFEFIDHIYTAHGNASTYSAIGNLHTLQINTAFAKPFLACCVLSSRSLATAPNSGDSLASCAQVLLSQSPVQSSTAVPTFHYQLNSLFTNNSAVKVKLNVRVTLRLAVSYFQNFLFVGVDLLLGCRDSSVVTADGRTYVSVTGTRFSSLQSVQPASGPIHLLSNEYRRLVPRW